MRIGRKIIAVLTAISLCFVMFSVFASAEEDELNYLVIGDSIAEGFGLKNPEEACYGRIVADTNGDETVDIADVNKIINIILNTDK